MTLARPNLAYSSAGGEGATDIDFLKQAQACYLLPLASMAS